MACELKPISNNFMKQDTTDDSEIDVFNINHNASSSFNGYTAISPSFNKAFEPMPSTDLPIPFNFINPSLSMLFTCKKHETNTSSRNNTLLCSVRCSSKLQQKKPTTLTLTSSESNDSCHASPVELELSKV